MTVAELTNILVQLPQHESRAVQTLRQYRERTGEIYPKIESKVERVRLLDDLIATSDAATKLSDVLLDLQPIPLVVTDNAEIEAWCLI